MKTIFDNRLFCISMSLVCAWFIYQDFSQHSTINILNLLYFSGFTFLSFCKKSTQKEYSILNNHEKNSALDTSINIENTKITQQFNEDKELQLTKIFKQ